MYTHLALLLFVWLKLQFSFVNLLIKLGEK